MLDDWEENLAVIAANRTKDDELVIIHLGDSLWKERSEVCMLALHLFSANRRGRFTIESYTRIIAIESLHKIYGSDNCSTYMLSSGRSEF